MKKAFKVIGKLVKWYLVLDIIAWSYIGIGQILRRNRRHPEETCYEIDMAVIDDATQNYKKWFRWVRGS